jgi:hypothetical protein
MNAEQRPAHLGHEDDHDTIRLVLNELRDNARNILTGAEPSVRWRCA